MPVSQGRAGRSRQNRNRPSRRQQRQQMPNAPRNELPSYGNLPFASVWNRFVERNAGKEIVLLFGIGTSGSSDINKMMLFAEDKRALNERLAFFYLCVDNEYSRTDEIGDSNRQTSMEPVLGPDLFDTVIEGVPRGRRYIHASNPSGDGMYLWGALLPTAYNKLEKYSQLRNDDAGPYEYGKHCNLENTPEVHSFYTPLLSFFRDPRISQIYVYNQGGYDTTLGGFERSRNEYYSGQEFRNEMRVIQIINMEEYVRRPSHLRMGFAKITEGQYFESFCEVLYCLYQSEKPVYLLKRQQGSQLLQESPLYNVVAAALFGGKRSKSRSQSRRRTVKSLGRK